MIPARLFPREDGPSTLCTLIAAIAVEYPDSEAERVAAAEVIAQHIAAERVQEDLRRAEDRVAHHVDVLLASVRRAATLLETLAE